MPGRTHKRHAVLGAARDDFFYEVEHRACRSSRRLKRAAIEVEAFVFRRERLDGRELLRDSPLDTIPDLYLVDELHLSTCHQSCWHSHAVSEAAGAELLDRSDDALRFLGVGIPCWVTVGKDTVVIHQHRSRGSFHARKN